MPRSPFCSSTDLHASCWIHKQKLGRTAETRDRWSQLFAKRAENVMLPPWVAAAFPSCGTSTSLPDLLTKPAPGDFQMPSASWHLGLGCTENGQYVTRDHLWNLPMGPFRGLAQALAARGKTRTSVQPFLAQNQPLAASSLLALPRPWKLVEQDPYRKTQTTVSTQQRSAPHPNTRSRDRRDWWLIEEPVSRGGQQLTMPALICLMKQEK